MAGSLAADFRDLLDRLHETADLGADTLWRLCEALPLTEGPGRGDVVQALLGDSGDLVRMEIPPTGAKAASAFFLATMVDVRTVNRGPLGDLSAGRPAGAVGEVSGADTYGDAVRGILQGQILVLADGAAGGLLIEAADDPTRQVGFPVLETVVRGPHIAFNEDLQTNIALVRQRLNDPRLTFESLTVGSLSRTEVRLCYVRGLTNSRLVAEARRRLAAVEATVVLDSNIIEESIVDDPYSLFPQLDFTERPDVVVAGLAEGRFALLVDTTNAALVAPVSFSSFIQAADDYYQNYWAGTFLRLLRFAFLGIALIMPALYIALTTFNQQMLPTPLLITLMRTRAGIPFPAVIEALIMEITLEILREASLHLPEKLGTGLSVVGALVIGQAVVSAGLVSWPMVAVVAITAIANFAIPRWGMALAIRLLRFAEMIAAAIFGLPGVLVVTAAIVVHLLSLRSFGLPYLFPAAPLDPVAVADALIRMPHWEPHPRPRLLAPGWRSRAAHRPRPPRRGGTVGRDPRFTRGGPA